MLPPIIGKVAFKARGPAGLIYYAVSSRAGGITGTLELKNRDIGGLLIGGG